MHEWQLLLKGIAKKSLDIVVLEEEKEIVIISGDARLKDEAGRLLGKKKPGFSVALVGAGQLLSKKVMQKLLEGYSLKANAPFSSVLGMRKKVLVAYSLSNLSHSQKTIFGYALRGRENETGILGRLKGETAGRNCLLVPEENFGKAIEFFAFWKVKYSAKTIFEKEGSRKDG